jgi:hypothetical protein
VADVPSGLSQPPPPPRNKKITPKTSFLDDKICQNMSMYFTSTDDRNVILRLVGKGKVVPVFN